ncbi:MAG: class A beta-lactamase-related serine hydrolase [Clostridiales bacterium]|jgi:beta-lactamase class A|nr:class A beta-lactamase-related serine hydrolase [Clostridiales bacterium]
MSEKRMLLTIFGLTLVFVSVFGLLLLLFVQVGAFDERTPAIHRHMRGDFITYSRPDFFADTVEAQRSQMVQILEERPDGWIHVAFGGRQGWVYMLAQPHHLDRPMGLFHSKDDAAYADLIEPGEVQVLLEEGNWLLISTNDGPMWLDLHFWPTAALLDDFFNSLPYNVAVYYKNLDTGFSYSHRGGVIYASASLNKAPHALYVYYLAESGLADLSQVHVFGPGNYRGGTGIIRFMPFGTEFTTNELLIHSVRDSDNAAFGMLLGLFANHYPSYREFYRSIGGNTDLFDNATGRLNLMTAEEAGLIMYRIYQYIESGGAYAHDFKDSLLNSDVPIIMADYPVAQKYGRWDGNFHDKAIVYAPSPYILVIMSTLDRHGGGAFEEFAEISRFIQDFNDRYFRPQ